jgi:signal transduction histidine kinase
MRERAMLIGAQLSIGTPPNGGTEVRLCIPPLEPGSR